MAHHQIVRVLMLFLMPLFLVACQKALLKTELSAYKLAYKPGEQLVASYEETKKKHRCAGNSSVYLEDSLFRPYKMVPGEQILTRFTYASCSAESISGTIVRQVTHKGKVVLKDTTRYTFVPGTWAVNAYIQIPPGASPGAYVFALTVKAGRQVFKETYSFQILQP
ncbi:hypothetical protein [Desulfococcus sp.]|uniref:hypothetical protein n=1 Tax=Desulfococcus sp. TaxID=2025834 RepID=UPI00359479EB